MSKFLVIKKEELPENLTNREFVVGEINFLEEIKAAERVKPRGNLIKPVYLKTIVDIIAKKYNGENKSAWTINYHNYEGVPFNDDEELNRIVLKMIEKELPITIENYYRTKIKSRPLHTHVIYFTAPMKFAGLFAREGIDQIINAIEVDDILKMKRFKKDLPKPENKSEVKAEIEEILDTIIDKNKVLTNNKNTNNTKKK